MRLFFASDPAVFPLPSRHGFSGRAWMDEPPAQYQSTNQLEAPALAGAGRGATGNRRGCPHQCKRHHTIDAGSIGHASIGTDAGFSFSGDNPHTIGPPHRRRTGRTPGRPGAGAPRLAQHEQEIAHKHGGANRRRSSRRCHGSPPADPMRLGGRGRGCGGQGRRVALQAIDGRANGLGASRLRLANAISSRSGNTTVRDN